MNDRGLEFIMFGGTISAIILGIESAQIGNYGEVAACSFWALLILVLGLALRWNRLEAYKEKAVARLTGETTDDEYYDKLP